MTAENKLVFITSDENLVHHLALQKPKNTHFIDLDTGERITSIVPAKTKSSKNATCTICGDHAIGYNYDVMSCASCKAFFHRYAYENPVGLKCLKGKNQCTIDHRISRRCIRCRLTKCLSMGMRKEFLHRRNHTEFDEIDQLLLNINENDINNIFNENLLFVDEDFAIIENVKTAFVSIFDNISQSFTESLDLSSLASAIVSWAQFDAEIALQTIRFFRQIPEFEHLHNDDRFILIKYNLFSLMLIRKTYNYRPTNPRTPIEIENERKRLAQFNALYVMPDDIQHMTSSMNDSIIQYTEHDPVLLSFLLVIGLFSPTLSLNLNEPLLHDSLSVYRAQSLYSKVLWSYLMDTYGEAKAYRKFIQITQIIFRAQYLSVQLRKLVRDIITKSNMVDKITTLMQTVLHIC